MNQERGSFSDYSSILIKGVRDDRDKESLYVPEVVLAAVFKIGFIY